MRTTLTLTMLAVALMATPAHADEGFFMSGNTLLKRMNSDQANYRANAMGYVTAVADFADGATFCIPENVNVRQMNDVARSFIEASPQYRHRSAAVLVTAALMQAFPCANSKKEPGGL